VLQQVREKVAASPQSIADIEKESLKTLAGSGWHPDYVAVRRQSDLQPPENGDKDLVVLGAAKLGQTRLIDNLEFEIGNRV
jgi:pantoate--beta-alanine ligase